MDVLIIYYFVAIYNCRDEDIFLDNILRIPKLKDVMYF